MALAHLVAIILAMSLVGLLGRIQPTRVPQAGVRVSWWRFIALAAYGKAVSDVISWNLTNRFDAMLHYIAPGCRTGLRESWVGLVLGFVSGSQRSFSGFSKDGGCWAACRLSTAISHGFSPTFLSGWPSSGGGASSAPRTGWQR
jgi:hypothetical protein